jgi:hypothetical protein
VVDLAALTDTKEQAGPVHQFLAAGLQHLLLQVVGTEVVWETLPLTLFLVATVDLEVVVAA